MKAVLQRVSFAQVKVDNEVVGEVNRGYLVLLGVENGDDERDADFLASKITSLRVFTDGNNKLNLSINDISGEILVISNFTLCADSSNGRRPSFQNAAAPDSANLLYEHFCGSLLKNGVKRVQRGIFGANMQVSLTNDGPVTIILDTKELNKRC